MKKDPCTKFYLITFLIMLQAILWFGLIAIIFLTPTTVENYLFKIITGSIVIILIIYLMNITERNYRF